MEARVGNVEERSDLPKVSHHLSACILELQAAISFISVHDKSEMHAEAIELERRVSDFHRRVKNG